MRYYRTGNWLWVFDRAWGLAIPAILLATGALARLRNAAHRLGRTWPLTIGLYVLFYLAIVFVVDLPLNYYAGFVRQHAVRLVATSRSRSGSATH